MAAAPDPHSLIVPGGGLTAHETGGGCTIERHVGVSTDDLRKRLEDEPTLRRASSFPNRSLAESAIAEALHHHGARVSGWVNARQFFDLEVLHELKLPVGIVLTRGAEPKATRRVRITLRRDVDRRIGYRLLTAYPT